MFKNKERELYERLLTEKERVIVALSDSLDWHRAQSGTFLGTALPAPVAMEEVKTEADLAFEQLLADAEVARPGALHMSEDEEEILWQLRHGGVGASDARTALAQASGRTELNFDVEE